MLCLPALLLLLVFNYIPMGGLVVAFQDFRADMGFLGSEWIGLKNFEFFFASDTAWRITRNTVLYNAVFIVLGLLFSVGFAILLNEIGRRFWVKTYQTIMFIPYFLSWVIVSYMLFALLDSDLGFLNKIIQGLGYEAPSWYFEPKYWPFIIVIMNIWKTLGYSTVIYYAAILGIDQDYYEAASIDGASKWQQARFITLPLMKLVIVMMFILAVGRIFYTDFGLFFQVPRDSNSLFNVATTIDVLVYKQLKTATVGMASASAFVQSVMGCLTILLANWVVRRVDPDSAMM